MYFPIECPSCQETVRVHSRQLGRKITCPACALRIAVPHEVALGQPGRPQAGSDEASAVEVGAAATIDSEPILAFRAFVQEDPGQTLAGVYRGVATAHGLQLWRGPTLAAVVGLGTAARVAAGNRLELAIDGRLVRLAVSRWGLPQPGLARDLVGLLHGDRGALQPLALTSNWPFLATLIPLGLPLLGLVRDGSRTLGAALGVALALACWFLARREYWSITVRKWLVVSLNGIGYAVLLAVLLGERSPESPAASPPEPPSSLPQDMVQVAQYAPRDHQELSPPRPPTPSMQGRTNPRSAAASPVYVVGPPNSSGVAKSDNSLTPSGRIGAWLSLNFDPTAGAVFATGLDATLRHYSYPGFRLLGTYRLPEPVYLAELDAPRGFLYAASSAPGALKYGSLGDRTAALGDLHVFDTVPITSGKVPPGELLRPVQTHPLAAEVRDLTFSPDHERLLCLWSNRRGIQIRALQTMHRTGSGAGRPRKSSFTGRTIDVYSRWIGKMYVAPDGRSLLCGWPKLLSRTDLTKQSPSRNLRLPVGARAGAANGANLLYLADYGDGGAVCVVDFESWTVAGQFRVPARGRVSLAMAPRAKHLLLTSWSADDSRILMLDVSAERATRPLLVGQAVSDENGVIRGESVISPDGRFLVNRAGRIFRID